MSVFENSKWIWINDGLNADEYAEFVFEFESFSCEEYFTLNIASDSNYNLFLNDQLIAFGQYADYPNYKVYDKIALNGANIGKNTIKVLVWHYGIDSQTYVTDKAGVIFELKRNNKTIYYSNEETLSRLCENYDNYRKINITFQLGLGFKYFANKAPTLPFERSVVVAKNRNFYPRPNEKLILKERKPITVTPLKDSYIIDLGEESVGFLDLDITTKTDCELKIYYGEYLLDGEIYKIPYENGGFYVEFVAKRGDNHYLNAFRRLAGRYLQVYSSAPIKINYIGLRETVYPVQKTPVAFKSLRRQKIYDTAVKTLHCCMHEHYEDCPWREQALYNMDSRNAMLFTYIAFNDYKFARSNLTLMANGVLEDGLLNICFPSGVVIPIPSFSTMYPVQVYEYIENSKDLSILEEVFEPCKKIAETFISKIDEKTALIKQLPAPYWNFYEWAYGSDNSDQINRPKDKFYPEKTDLLINCLFLYMISYYKKLCALKGESFDFDETPMRKAIVETFYNFDKKLFKATDTGAPFYTVLGNALASIVGFDDLINLDLLIDKENFAIPKTIDYQGDDYDNAPTKIVPISLSMNMFLYEALLKKDKKYANFILREIDEKFGKMLDNGSTTFWETELGYKDFNMRGSLCHAWSALPIYFYKLLNDENYFNGSL